MLIPSPHEMEEYRAALNESVRDFIVGLLEIDQGSTDCRYDCGGQATLADRRTEDMSIFYPPMIPFEKKNFSSPKTKIMRGIRSGHKQRDNSGGEHAGKLKSLEIRDKSDLRERIKKFVFEDIKDTGQ